MSLSYDFITLLRETGRQRILKTLQKMNAFKGNCVRLCDFSDEYLKGFESSFSRLEFYRFFGVDELDILLDVVSDIMRVRHPINPLRLELEVVCDCNSTLKESLQVAAEHADAVTQSFKSVGDVPRRSIDLSSTSSSFSSSPWKTNMKPYPTYSDSEGSDYKFEPCDNQPTMTMTNGTQSVLKKNMPHHNANKSTCVTTNFCPKQPAQNSNNVYSSPPPFLPKPVSSVSVKPPKILAAPYVIPAHRNLRVEMLMNRAMDENGILSRTESTSNANHVPVSSSQNVVRQVATSPKVTKPPSHLFELDPVEPLSQQRHLKPSAQKNINSFPKKLIKPNSTRGYGVPPSPPAFNRSNGRHFSSDSDDSISRPNSQTSFTNVASARFSGNLSPNTSVHWPKAVSGNVTPSKKQLYTNCAHKSDAEYTTSDSD